MKPKYGNIYTYSLFHKTAIILIQKYDPIVLNVDSSSSQKLSILDIGGQYVMKIKKQ